MGTYIQPICPASVILTMLGVQDCMSGLKVHPQYHRSPWSLNSTYSEAAQLPSSCTHTASHASHHHWKLSPAQYNGAAEPGLGLFISTWWLTYCFTPSILGHEHAQCRHNFMSSGSRMTNLQWFVSIHKINRVDWVPTVGYPPKARIAWLLIYHIGK